MSPHAQDDPGLPFPTTNKQKNLLLQQERVSDYEKSVSFCKSEINVICNLQRSDKPYGG